MREGIAAITDALGPAPKPGAVRVWQFDLDSLAQFAGHFASLLSPDERKRAAAFATAQLRHRFGVGRGVLRLVLGGYLGQPPESLEFAYGPCGKPGLAGPWAEWKFNLTHSGSIALMAVSPQAEVGVDVECHRPLADLAALADLCLSERERHSWRLLADAQKQAEFYRIWTFKESLLKASGEGLQVDLRSLEISAGGRVVRWPPRLEAYRAYRIQRLPLSAADAALAVAPAVEEWRCGELPVGIFAAWAGSP